MRFKRQWGGHLKFDNQVLLQSQVKKWYKGENETHWKRLLYKSDKGIISFTQGGFKMKRTQSAYCSSFVTVMCHWCWTSQTCHYGSTQSFFLPTKSNTHPLFTNCHLGVLWTSHCQSHTKDKWCFIPYFLTGQCMWWNQTVCWKVTESFRGSMDTGKHELLQWASAKQKCRSAPENVANSHQCGCEGNGRELTVVEHWVDVDLKLWREEFNEHWENRPTMGGEGWWMKCTHLVHCFLKTKFCGLLLRSWRQRSVFRLMSRWTLGDVSYFSIFLQKSRNTWEYQ